MKKRVTIEAVYSVEIEIPDHKLPDLLTDYQDTIKENADIDDLFAQAAYAYCFLDEDEFIEGLGDVKKQGIKFNHSERELEYSTKDL
jgi:hypothetical protein